MNREPIFIDSTITNELDTRQEFLRVDYNVSTNWSVTGRYLHDRVDSLGEYLTLPDLAPGHRYLLGHLAVVEARHVGERILYELSYQLSRHTLSRKDPLPARGDIRNRDSRDFPGERGEPHPETSTSRA